MNALQWSEVSSLLLPLLELKRLPAQPLQHALTREAADAICVQRALSGEDKCRGFKAFRYRAKTWGLERRFVARIEATPKGLDVRYVVTSLKAGARHLYETLYCARGYAENLIKMHKSQLASDRTS